MTVGSAKVAAVLTALTIGIGLAGCGKKGNPLAPLRPVPLGITDAAARRVDDRIELTLTVPKGNVDGSTPAAITRVDVYAATTAGGAPPPGVAAIVGEARNLRRQFAIAEPPADRATVVSAQARPAAPGDLLTFTESVGTIPAVAGAAAVHYVAVPVAGTGRGRPGESSGVITVPLAELPAPPRSLSVSHDESSILLTWQPAAEGHEFRVLSGSRSADPEPKLDVLTPTPIKVAEHKVPVEFGAERCFAVRAVETRDRTVIESAPTALECVTPVDRYPPAAPTRLEAIQEGAALTLIWAPVAAGDLAGYVVLRADGPSDRLQPLMREPIAQAMYRDASVQSGVTYVYAVIALDTLGNPSEQSQRQTITVR